MNELRSYIDKYLEWGLNLIPLNRSKRPALDEWEPYQSRKATDSEIKLWFSSNSVNIGIICGSISGNFGVLDCDSDELFLGIAAFWKEAFGDSITSMTPVVQSREGRHHIYLRFKQMPPLYHPVGEMRKSMPDIQGEKGYVMAPPSIHPETKKPYEFLNPDITTIFGVDSLSDLAIEIPTAPRSITRNEPVKILEGSRNSFLTSLAGSMRRRGMSEAAIFAALTTENEERCEPPLAVREVTAIARSVARYKPAAGEPARRPGAIQEYHYTDMGNAQRFATDHQNNVRFCNASGAWLIWDGQRWARDIDGGIMRKAKETVTNLYVRGSATADEKQREKIIKWALQSEAEARLKAMVALAESEQNIPVRLNELDTNPWLLNVLNGTLDLRTGELRPHDPADMLSKSANAAYYPTAKCPRFLAFLDRIFEQKAELATFVQRAVGYSLTADMTEQVLFLLYGVGANGKTTFLEIIRLLLGDYAENTPFASFLARENETVRNDLARLVGARFVSSAEVRQAQRLDEVVIKQVTGGDTITARFLYREYFEFLPCFKLWLAVNHKPVIRGTEEAIWRRIRLIPFEIIIPEAERDRKLLLKLQAELPGILAWAVQGCLDWQNYGLNPPEAVTEATACYRSEMDLLGAFLESAIVHVPGGKIDAKRLYESYCQWCEREGEKPLNTVWFSRNMRDRGFKVQRSTAGKREWVDIDLAEEH